MQTYNDLHFFIIYLNNNLFLFYKQLLLFQLKHLLEELLLEKHF
ncbi:hypothetical protein XFF6991_580001 [Xanthomonas phaseoli pv. phaseoli]|uniref:Uncharacterized protein n=1 Tax=Xanthomonas campestris pv. phaseoli TaxID=317013 RepID=A0A7Z7J6Y0_XANCH|nr:hypothetical protein XFF6991_580001 [Xanthomonas phaseoli pv. phaseoli]